MAAKIQASSLGLRGIALFEGLPAERLEELARQCAWRNYDAGQRIISRDALDKDVYFLVSGRVRVTTYSPGGKQVTFHDFERGEFFGDVAAVDGRPRSADVLALQSALLASMPQALFRGLVRDEPVVAERLLRRLAGLVRSASERVIELSTLGVHNRIHAELLRLARQAGVSRNTARIDPSPKHADLASQVSTYREQVTRELSALVRAGIVGKEGRALVVRDVAGLEKMVQDVRRSA